MNRPFKALLAVLVLLNAVVTTSPVHALELIPEFRLLTAYQSRTDVYQLGATWALPSAGWLRADRTEVTLGIISGAGKSRSYYSFGPVWRLNAHHRTYSLEFGFSPTILGGAGVGGEDLGGVVQFTSSLAVSRAIGRSERNAFAIRIQHLSNGGLNHDNPGLDTVGLSFTTAF